jgi:hypothetical protein
MTRAKPTAPVVARTRSVAHALAVVPAAIDDGDRAELRRHFSEADAEWIVLLSIAMMGFLNKAMDP